MSAFLGASPGVYICNCPEPAWYDRFGLARRFNYSVEKKRRMFACMAPGSIWISPTFDVAASGPTDDFQNGDILHIGNGHLPGRLGQFAQSLKILKWLIANRTRYGYCFVYNYYLPVFLAPLATKIFASKPLFVDYEDDDAALTGSRVRRAITSSLQRASDGAVCVHERLAGQFPAGRTCVCNGFADLRYAREADFRLFDGMTLLFASRLDDVRGADLLPELVRSLRTCIADFRVVVTGDGPARRHVEAMEIPELEFLGFLPADRFDETLRTADACLILQKPDHPFTFGSFPSKVDSYAQYRKPIFVLEPTTTRPPGL